ncbi:MAG: sigma-70 family RNA polymerase sigma factor [Thermomicrobiales bacterium]|nr:sigma-70 family RNA polymerase sigma factor [Thermomicrobiales bacterium]
MTDDELVRLAQTDPEQFGELYRRYVGEIERFVRSRVTDAALAEDITSKVFTKVMLAIPRFTEGSFRAWLYQITRNTIIDEYRRTKPNLVIDDLPIPDPASSPEDVAITNDAAARLHAALDHLKPTQREIVRLRLHGLGVKEIAERLNMSENAVKSAQRRAFIALKSVPGVMP